MVIQDLKQNNTKNGKMGGANQILFYHFSYRHLERIKYVF